MRVVVLPELQRRRRVLELVAFLIDVKHGVQAETVYTDRVEPPGDRGEPTVLHDGGGWGISCPSLDCLLFDRR